MINFRKSSYFILAKMLFATSSVFSRVVAVGLLFVIISGLMAWMWPTNLTKILAVFGVILVFMIFVTSLFSLPGQLLALNSSKQFLLLPKVRISSCAILFAFCLVTALVISILAKLIDAKINVVSLFFASFLFVSGALVSVIFFAAFSSGTLVLIFVFLFFTTGKIFSWLLVQNNFTSTGLSILVWSAYAFWWVNWRPAKRRLVLFSLIDSRINFFNLEIDILGDHFRFLGSQPKTLLGATLLGRSEGLLASFKSNAINLAFFIAVLVFFSLSPEYISSKKAPAKLYVCLFFICIFVSSSFSVPIFRKLSNAWLLLSMPRATLFFQIEKISMNFLLPTITPLLLLYLVGCILNPYIFLDFYFGVLLAFFSVSFSLLLQYLTLFLYVKKISLLLCQWISISLSLIGLVIVFSGGEYWNSKRSAVILAGVLLLVVVWMTNFLLRRKTIGGWRRVDFIRVKN